ncbi:unnamed protein product, partial [Mesorhabditis belari]|uniref:Bromo domain-containing protein n=1 Tax=Mesorhabditis belari TaxID=2138241 RepID=A0AAF3J8E2_9BILA
MAGEEEDQCEPSTSKQAESRASEENGRAMDPLAFELCVLIERHLSAGPFRKVGAHLRQELDRHALVPRTIDYLGESHPTTYKSFIGKIHPSNLSSLDGIIKRLADLNSKEVPQSLAGLPRRLLLTKRNAIDRTPESINEKQLLRGAFGPCLTIKPSAGNCFTKMIRARELGGNVTPRHLIPPGRVISMSQQFRVTGHFDPIYCVLIDRTGQYILTGADDSLIKVWDLRRGTLRYTFRGHESQISDMTISTCNSYLITASVDKSVRVWNLQNGACIKTYRAHTAQISSVKWLPFSKGSTRWLITTSWDCSICFYRYDCKEKEFSDNVVSIYERDAPGMRLCTSTHSPGGGLIAVGDSQQRVRLFSVDEKGPQKLQELEGHTDRVDSLVWAHSGVRLASGSPDGTARVWTVRCGKWRHVTLKLDKSDQTLTAQSIDTRKISKYKILMLCWASDDSRLITAGNDSVFRVWDPKNGSLMHRLVGNGVSYVLVPHSINPNLLFTASHDGKLMLWDIFAGKLRKHWDNTLETGGCSPLFDLALSEDGTSLAVVDANGRLTLFGMGMAMGSNRMVKLPRTQIKMQNNNFGPLTYDALGFPYDHRTGIPPHLLPPPRLMQTDFVISEEMHRLIVPGRDVDNVREEELQCAWTHRKIIPELSFDQLAMEEQRLRQIYTGEINFFEQEISKEDQDAEEEKEPQPQIQRTHRPPEQRRTNLAATLDRIATAAQEEERLRREARIAQRTERRMRRLRQGHLSPIPLSQAVEGDNSFERNAGSGSENENNSDESTSGSDVDDEEETSDSDFSVGPRRENEERTRRRYNKETATSSQEPELNPRRTKRQEDMLRKKEERRKRREEEENNPQSVPGPSRRQRRYNRHNSTIESIAEETGANMSERVLSDLDWEYRFPDHYKRVTPARFPYFAQPGDLVVYFKQGHEAYLKQLSIVDIYDPTRNMLVCDGLDAEEFCIVTHVSYTMKPYRLVVVNLARVDRRTNVPTGKVWAVKFHDLDNVADFIVLRQFYDESMEHRFDVGDQIEAVLDSQWWTGVIKSRQPKDPELPSSHWYCLHVAWDSGEEEPLSPWDMQPKTQNRRSESVVSEEEHLTLAHYVLQRGDWPSNNRDPDARSNFEDDRDAATRLLQRAIAWLIGQQDFVAFIEPVSLTDYEDYPLAVAYPSDLGTITERLINKFYRRLAAFQLDVCQICKAAESYNDPTMPIVKNAKILAAALIDLSKNIFDTSIENSLDKVKEMTIGELNTMLKEYLRRPSRNKQNRGYEMMNVELTKPGWKTDIAKGLKEICRDKCARHFLNRENPTTEMHAIWSRCDPEVRSLEEIIDSIEDESIESPNMVLDKIVNMIAEIDQTDDDRRSEIYRNGLLLKQKVEEKILPIIKQVKELEEKAKSLLNLDAVRELRETKRNHKLHAYDTRHRDDLKSNMPSTSKAVCDYSDEEFSNLRKTRALRRQKRSETVEELEESDDAMGQGTSQASAKYEDESEEEIIPRTRKRTQGGRVVKELDNLADLDASTSELGEDRRSRRDRRAQSTTAPQPQHLIVETTIGNGRPSRRCSTRTGGAMKRTRDDSSDDHYGSPKRNAARRKPVSYAEDSDDEDEPTESISQRGRVRKVRKFD